MSSPEKRPILRERISPAELLTKNLKRVVVVVTAEPKLVAGAGSGTRLASTEAGGIIISTVCAGSRNGGVVLQTSSRIPKHLKRPRDLFEHHLRVTRVTGVLIRVPPHGEAPVGFLYLGL